MLDYVQDPSSFVFAITEPIGNFLVEYGLEPLRAFLVETPVVVHRGPAAVAIALGGSAAGGPRSSALADAAPRSGSWACGTPAMDNTASQVLVATGLAVAFGFVLGVWAAESRRVERTLRPILDVLQTLPQLVYIIPFIYLMPVSRVPGVVASVLYATPVVIRLVAAGSARRGPECGRGGFGVRRDAPARCSRKVKVPLARDAIMLGVNQGTIMVLSVVVIAGLVGSGALGDLVARGLQRNEFGLGVVASLAILALGIALDRVTQGNSPRGRASGAPVHVSGSEDGKGGVHESSKTWSLLLDLSFALRAGLSASALAVARRRATRPRACDTARCDHESRRRTAARRTGGLRRRHDQRERLGGLDGERLHREVRARDQVRLHRRRHEDRRDPGLPGDGRRQGRRGARGLAARRPVQDVHRATRGRSSRAARSASRGTSAGSSRST